MKSTLRWCVAALLLCGVNAMHAAQLSCEPQPTYRFICGNDKPEDLALIPGTRWLIASGFSAGSGLKLVNVDARVARRWYDGTVVQKRHDRARYPDCADPPDAALFNVQGINLRRIDSRTFLLYATNHGGRESIEAFRIDVAGAAEEEPTLTWTGCVRMPDGMAANSVASFADGGLLATVLIVPGTQMADYVLGKVTGRVYEWRPGMREFRHVEGADLSGNNGIEISKDESEFYVVAFGARSVMVFARGNPAKLLRSVVAPGFMPDNIHWDGERLLAAGMQYDEPACGGTRKVIDGKADLMACHRGYVVAWLEPRTLAWQVVSYSEPNPSFNGVSTGLLIGRDLWLGSWQVDRIAVRTLP